MDKYIDINGYLLVDVPEGAKDFRIGWSSEINIQAIKAKFDTTKPEFEQKLPKGNYQIVGLGKDLTEEQWKEIVGEPPFCEYENTNLLDPDYKGLFVATATESGHSLLEHHGLELSTTLILKKIL